MTVDIFDSFDAEIKIAEKINVQENYLISDSKTITFNNRGCERDYPKLTITTSSSATLSTDFITVGSNSLSFSSDIALGDTNTLVLDFEKQIYELDGNNIIDRVNFSDDLIYFPVNQKVDMTFSLTDDISVDIEYSKYKVPDTFHYIEDWSLDPSYSYQENKPYNSNKRKDSYRNEETYSFSIGKYETDWQLYNGISKEKDYRITYKEYVPTTNETEIKYLIGVTFDSYNKSFSMGDFILSDISGECNDILDKK